MIFKIGRKDMASDACKEKLEALIKIYDMYIYRVCLKILGNRADAEDATQDTYVKIIEYVDRLDDIPSDRTRKYISKTAQSVAKNMLKSEKRKRYMDIARLDDEKIAILLERNMARMILEEIYARNNCIDRINEYMCIFDPIEQSMLEYHSCGCGTFRETAEYFGMKPATFRKRIQRLRERVESRKMIIEKER